MDIQAEKLRLIQWLAGLNDPGTIREFVDLKKAKEVDWWDTISEEERAEIEEGLAQADRGEVVPHDEVMSKYKKWL
jgi:predicted transcriptional regulator